MNEKKLELKVNNLIALRGALLAVNTILAGGIVGLLLALGDNPLKIVFIVIGFYLLLHFTYSIEMANEKINKYLKGD